MNNVDEMKIILEGIGILELDINTAILKLKELGKCELHINAQDENGMTLLHWAASFKNIRAIKELIELGADINLEDRSGKSFLNFLGKDELSSVQEVKNYILMNLIKKSELDRIRKFLQQNKNLDVNFTDSEGNSAVLYAIENSKMNVLVELMKQGAKINLDETIINKISEHILDSGIEERELSILLFYSVKHNNIFLANALLRKNIDINIRQLLRGNFSQFSNMTPLMVAAQNNNTEMVKLLMDRGADAALDLLSAIKEENYEVTRMLVENGVDVNLSRRGETPIKLAIESGNLEILKYLLNKGADINTKTVNDVSLLHIAVFHRMYDVVKILIEKGIDVNLKDIEGETPLSLAVLIGLYETAKILIDRGANVDAEKSDGTTPLMVASLFGRMNEIELLLEHNAGINKKDKIGDTPLLLSILNKEKATTKLLIEKGADIHAKREDGTTPLMMASFYGMVEVMEILIKRGADVNARKTDGSTALTRAAHNGKYEAVRILLEHEVDVNALNNEMETPLFLASQKGYTNIVELLIEKGADVNIKNTEGKTPLLMAIREKRYDLAKMLLQNGARIEDIENILSERQKIEYFSNIQGKTLCEKQKNLILENIKTQLEKRYSFNFLRIGVMLAGLKRDIDKYTARDLKAILDDIRGIAKEVVLPQAYNPLGQIYLLIDECKNLRIAREQKMLQNIAQNI